MFATVCILARFPLRPGRLAVAAAILGTWLGTPAVGAGSAPEHPYEVFANEVYAERESGRLYADVYRPEGDGPYPGVLVIHGGAWTIGSKRQLRYEARSLAARGYVAVAINYRLAPQHKFPAQLDDCRDALRWVHDEAPRLRIDPQRMGAYGYSAGAHLAAMLGMAPLDAGVDAGRDGLSGQHLGDRSPTPRITAAKAASGPLAAIVAGGTPCDFRPLPPDNRMLSYWLGATRRERPDVYDAASPAAFVSPDDPPIFFYHGVRDRLVPIALARQMERQLQKVGVRTAFLALDQADHMGAFRDRDATAQAIAFLDSILRPPSPK